MRIAAMFRRQRTEASSVLIHQNRLRHFFDMIFPRIGIHFAIMLRN